MTILHFASRRTVVTLSLCVLFLVAFFAFESHTGQRWLIERASRPGMTHVQEDDIHMGAGLAPYVYLLIPCVACGGLGILFAVIDLMRNASKT
jgi:hypothetical protein